MVGSLGHVIVFIALQCFHMTNFDRGDVILVVFTTTETYGSLFAKEKTQRLGGVYHRKLPTVWTDEKQRGERRVEEKSRTEG